MVLNWEIDTKTTKTKIKTRNYSTPYMRLSWARKSTSIDPIQDARRIGIHYSDEECLDNCVPYSHQLLATCPHVSGAFGNRRFIVPQTYKISDRSMTENKDCFMVGI